MYTWKNQPAQPSTGSSADRRTSARLAVSITVQACRVTQGRFCALEVLDISAGGLRFVSPGPLVVGEVVELRVPVDQSGPLAVVGKVTWCRGLGERQGACEGGINFTRISVHSHERLTRYLATLK